MPATARVLNISAEEIAQAGQPRAQGTWAEIEVPGDYEATLADVNDFVSKAGHPGWKFTYQLPTSTGPVELHEWVTFQDSVKWKLSDILKAHGITGGINTSFQPGQLIGDVVGLSVGWQMDKVTGEPTTYREIKAIFSLAELPEDEETPAAL
jgi:hypothetical protein